MPKNSGRDKPIRKHGIRRHSRPCSFTKPPVFGGYCYNYILFYQYAKRQAGRHRLGNLRFYLHNVSFMSCFKTLAMPILGASVAFILAGALLFFAVKITGLDREVAIGIVFGGAGIVAFLVLVPFMQAALFKLYWKNLRADNGAQYKHRKIHNKHRPNARKVIRQLPITHKCVKFAFIHKRTYPQKRINNKQRQKDKIKRQIIAHKRKADSRP